VKLSTPLKFLPELVSGRGTARRSRGVEGCALPNTLRNEEQNTLEVVQNIGGRNAQRLDPARAKPSIPGSITSRPIAPRVRLAIHFDAKLRPIAVEIERIRSRGMLLAPFKPGLRAAKLLPQQHFGQRHLPPQFARSVIGFAGTPDHLPAPKRRINRSTMLRMVPLPETSSGRNER
jgi:hypothetical protein